MFDFGLFRTGLRSVLGSLLEVLGTLEPFLGDLGSVLSRSTEQKRGSRGEEEEKKEEHGTEENLTTSTLTVGNHI